MVGFCHGGDLPESHHYHHGDDDDHHDDDDDDDHGDEDDHGHHSLSSNSSSFAWFGCISAHWKVLHSSMSIDNMEH